MIASAPPANPYPFRAAESPVGYLKGARAIALTVACSWSGWCTFLTDTAGSESRKSLTAERARVSNGNTSVGTTKAAVCNQSLAALGWHRPERLEDGGGDRQAGIRGG